MTWARDHAFYGMKERMSVEEYMEKAGPRYGHCEQSVPLFHLPHQCDEWIIGDAEDMQDFIDACQALLDRLNNDVELDWLEDR